MTALNKKGVSRRTTAPKAVSYNGNVQFAKTDAFQLYDLIVSHFFGKDTFYESHDERVKRMETLVSSVVASNNLDFVANAIVYARHTMNMRSMPLVLAVYFAKALQDRIAPYAAQLKVLQSKSLRSTTDQLVVADLQAKIKSLQYPQLRSVIRDVIVRADEPAAMLNIAIQVFGNKKHLPMALKRGIGDAMNKFNEYQFAKWG